MGAHTRTDKNADYKLFSRYARDRLVFHENLVVPAMLLYRDHLDWSIVHGGGLTSDKFIQCLEEAGITITANGRGKLKRAACGVGLRPK